MLALAMANLADQRESVFVGQANVADQHVRRSRLESVEGLRYGTARHHVRTNVFENRRHELTNVRVVFDHQDVQAIQPLKPLIGETRLVSGTPFVGRGGSDDWHAHGEHRSSPWPVAFGSYRSVVLFNDLMGDREAEAEPTMPPGRRAVGLPEAVEHMRKKIRPDPFACIADDDFDVIGSPCDRDINAAIFRRELDGVAQEVPDDLLESPKSPLTGSLA